MIFIADDIAVAFQLAHQLYFFGDGLHFIQQIGPDPRLIHPVKAKPLDLFFRVRDRDRLQRSFIGNAELLPFDLKHGAKAARPYCPLDLPCTEQGFILLVIHRFSLLYDLYNR